jgi:hypothetical protein
MAAEITPISPLDFLSQTYGDQDTNLISTFDINTSFSSSSYIEYFTYDNNQNILSSDYNFSQYTIQNDGQSAGEEGNVSEIILDPEQILVDRGFDQGEYTTYFNFFNKQIGSDLEQLYIAEISSDRTEIRLDSTDLDNLSIVEQTSNFVTERENSIYFIDFYLNFGRNQLTIANNIQLDNTDPNNPTILIKLYEALPEEFDLNFPLWVVTVVEEPRAYKVTFEDTPIIISDTVSIKGPNFNLDLKDQINNSTAEVSYFDLITTSLTSSQNQLNSLLEEKEIDINIDYTNFSDFIHFSSAKTRLENFYYKVSLIEEYSSSIAILNNTTNNNPRASIAIYESKIDNIITNFDGYDYYLYYSSGSWAWPKSTTKPPYQLFTTGSNTVLTWFGSDDPSNPNYGGIILSASIYDQNNKDNLYFVIPEYLRDDANNDQYLLFVEMVGQHYDNIWIYYKDVTQKYNADNRLEYGISKDIVADAIRDFGVKLYQNNFSNIDLYTAFLGLTPDGALFPFPNITGSLPTPSGFEYVNTLISASNDYLPLDDVNKSLYKRIYHNLPYLLKSKGTLPGLRALITSYGIPDTILRINEYGGKDKSDSNDWDYWQNEFNYAFYTTGSNYITTPWELNSNWNSQDNVPSSVIFRFKTNGLPQTNIPYSQSLWYLNDVSSSSTNLLLTYTGSGYTSGSYSGSIIDPYYQYATLTFTPDYINYPNSSASIYLPFFDGGWWSVMINRNGDDFGLSAGNKIYEGGDNGTVLGFFETALLTADSTLSWALPTNSSVFGKGNNTLTQYKAFSGSYQEIRYYNYPLKSSTFKDYIMNPYSIKGGTLNGGPDNFAFRASLGGELYTGSVSIHPKVTGSWAATSSFISNSNFTFLYPPVFTPNTEYFFYDQPVVGIKNTISDKIRLENNTLPSGEVLSPFRALSQTTEASQSYTANVNYLEVAFSPQNEINEDIMDQLGYFNIGEYIGDPSLRSTPDTSYPALDKLRNDYFQKYTKNYDLVDFIRLIKFFDNSLFKMIKDFVPARTSLASGIVIKQHLLERNKYPQPQVEWEDLDISGTLKPTWNDFEPGTVENFSGGTGGSFETFNYVGNVSQSWYETIQSPLGLVVTLHNEQDEFYDGEFSGSVIVATTQSLNQPYTVENIAFNYTPILFLNSNFGQPSQSTFANNQLLNSYTVPYNGEILISVGRKKPSSGGVSTLGVNYIKIAKNDYNGNNSTIPLGQITNLLIKYSNYSLATNYKINNITEYPTYYLYDIEVNSQYSTVDNEIKNYRVSSSITGSSPIPVSLAAIGSWNVTSGNIAHYGTPYFNTSSGLYLLENTPNIPLILTASITTSGSSGGAFGYLYAPIEGTGVLDFVSFGSGANIISTITASFNFKRGDYFALVYGAISSTLKSGSFLLTQSITPIAAVQDSVILEPYISVPNFYNSDQNALLNDVQHERTSLIYEDVDYSTGLLIPTNFGAIISGSATKASVQDSNYTTKRHIIPRYEGSKTTSQFLNTWTDGDTGTYGKLPSIESNKTYVAYCDSVGGWAPEKMNCTSAFVKYFISEDGDIISPNTEESALYINQGTFISRENIKIESLGASTNTIPQYRTVFRGGTKIEPILYNQIKHYQNPPMSFTGSIEFTDDNPSSVTTVNNYTATLTDSAGAFGSTSWSGISMNKILMSGSAVGTSLANPNVYTASAALISEGLDLVFQVDLNIFNNNLTTSTAYARIIRNRSGVVTPVGGTGFVNGSGYIPGATVKLLSFTTTIPAPELAAGDVFQIQLITGNSSVGYNNTSTWKISTNPLPTTPISTTGLFYTVSTPGLESALYTTSSALLQYYNLQGVHQKDIDGSGFNPVTLPFTVEVGDEFRFEGDESKTFMVNNVGLFTLIPNLPILQIILDRPISGSGINVNEFVLRRYVDSAGSFIFDGSVPSGVNSPYIIKPEYISDKMEQNIGKYIADLTNKGLL